MKKMSENNQVQLSYIERLFDEKLLTIQEKIIGKIDIVLQKLKEQEKRIDKSELVIYGNGKKGLIERVNWIEDKLLIIISVVSLLATLFFSLIKDFLLKLLNHKI